ncbi:MAG: cysteine synthase family protein [Oscillospiraceae bacterium]|jgi:cysteine synthase A|nr:cysteine synthase family protein [Oscillospiraceae bacterium]
MIYNNVLEAVGNTPVIRLNRMPGENDAEVLAKFEGVNIGGSIKTRTAWNMIREAELRGEIQPDTVIVETTSGNQGVGLALVGAVRGYRTVIVMPDSVSEERAKLIKHYGAQVILVKDCGDIGACIETCLQTALELQAGNPKVYIPKQFENPDNPAVHWSQTGAEILEQVGRPIHGFCAGIGTGGCISGVGGRLRERYPAVEIWALEPENGAILSGRKVGSHIQMGIGDGLVPDVLNTEIYDRVEIVTDEEALRAAKDLARLEGLMCGISSGTNVAAALRLAKKLGRGKTVLTLLPDTGERYFSTPLFD